MKWRDNENVALCHHGIKRQITSSTCGSNPFILSEMFLKFLTPLIFASAALGLSVLNAPPVIPALFKHLGPAQDSSPLTFTLHLQQANMDGLNKRMEHIATAQEPWLSEDQLSTFVRPAQATMNAVLDFLKVANLSGDAVSQNSFGDKMIVTTTVGQAKRLFPGTEFSVFYRRCQSVHPDQAAHDPRYRLQRPLTRLPPD